MAASQEAEGSRFRTRRSGYVEPHAGAKSVDAKQVSSIRDGEDAVQMILPGNGGQPGSGFFRIGAVRLSNDLILRDPVGEKVVMADSPLRSLAGPPPPPRVITSGARCSR